MERKPFFDVHDRDVPPVVYHLIFSFVYPTPNDEIHLIGPDHLSLLLENVERTRETFDGRMRHPGNNCYTCDSAALAALKARSRRPTLEEAVEEYKRWLVEKNVEPSEEVLVSVWW
jgi:hypothetical protein